MSMNKLYKQKRVSYHPASLQYNNIEEHEPFPRSNQTINGIEISIEPFLNLWSNLIVLFYPKHKFYI